MFTHHPTTIKILIIDDDEDDFIIISEYIKRIPGRYFTIDWTFHYHEAIEHMCSGNYDIYFVDYRLGIKTGLELLRDAIKKSCEEPIILLTGRGNQEIDEEAMEAGAVDYLVKSDLTTEKLERCIRYSLDRAASIRALKQNEKKFRNIFEKSKDAIFIAYEDLVFKEVNRELAELLGFSREECKTHCFYDFFFDREQVPGIQQELLEKKEMVDKELLLVTKKNKRIICLFSATREVDEQGQYYVQGIIHNITALKNTEKANLQAEKLNTASRLIQTLAHEVRGPLTNISLSVENIMEEKSSEESKEYLEIILRNSKRINDLISELLGSTRSSDMEMLKIPLDEVLDQTLALAADRIRLKKISISVSAAEMPAFIMGDAGKLKIAFLNIITNAIEAINHTEGALWIRIEENHSQYHFSIADNGIGISEENLVRLFEPYFTSKRNGLGLGLAATLAILQSHRCTIDVSSKPGEGTTFMLSFPKA
jgi:PAS domain S-box-containing protein